MTGVAHVYPNGEEDIHYLNGLTCWCGIRGEVRIQSNITEDIYWIDAEYFEEAEVIIHRAFDGRR